MNELKIKLLKPFTNFTPKSTICLRSFTTAQPWLVFSFLAVLPKSQGNLSVFL